LTIEAVLALLVFLFPLAYSPGPGNAFFAAIGASKGLKAAIPALTGYHVATFLVTVLVGIGLGVTILSDPVVSRVLAAAGSLYVLWLAWGFIRAARARAASPGEPPRERRIGFWSGAVVLLLNPKAYYIIAVMFTQFLQPPANEDLVVVLVITVVFTINNLIAFVVWTVSGRALTALFRSDRARQVIDYLFAATLVLVAVWMLIPLFV
jgi:threonine/homoserine/homoserine lactone efflux protein